MGADRFPDATPLHLDLSVLQKCHWKQKSVEAVTNQRLRGEKEARLELLRRTLGLKWRDIGFIKPSNGKALDNAELATLLNTKVELSQAEWDELGVDKLRTKEWYARISTSTCASGMPRAPLPWNATETCGHLGPREGSPRPDPNRSRTP